MRRDRPLNCSWREADEERPSSRFFLAGSRRGETEFKAGRRQGEIDL